MITSFRVYLIAVLSAAFLVGVPTSSADDCNNNGVDDECDIECGMPGEPCDVPGCGEASDCDGNGIPDECDLAEGSEACRFPVTLSENTTGFDDSIFTGPPDDDVLGIGGQVVTYEFDCALLIDGSGPDFTVYERDGGLAEFNEIDVLVSADGITFISVKSSESSAVDIPGDEAHGSSSFARSYDLVVSGLAFVRHVRIDGDGDGAAGGNAGFDLDAIGAIHLADLDCNTNGILDSCDIAAGTSPDCNANAIPDECDSDCNDNAVPDDCDISGGTSTDCNANAIPDECDPDCNDNGIPDECDISEGTSEDMGGNGIPDECDPDCNGNGIPDDSDISQGTSIDCNINGVPDECDLAGGTSEDCNDDTVPDECPNCSTIQVIFVMDTSLSMDGEAAALCGSIVQVVTELENRGLEVEELLLGISDNPGGDYSCLTDNVIDLLGTDVPGSPPPGNETLGDCPGGSEVASEDWGRAVSVVAGLYPWTPDSVRVIVPLSDEGPWCGNPVSDPGVDRDSITHAITIALANDVMVSPVTGTGSSEAVIGLAEELAAATGGMSFSSSKPADDLATAIADLILGACATVFDCNSNGFPDDCDLAAGTSTDCNANAIPDECELDCNTNDIPDECDLAGGTSIDCDSNGVPDECDPDCNANMIPDTCDIAVGTSTDCDADGIPDECNAVGLVRVGDRDDFDDADGDGVANLVTGDSVDYPGLGSGESSGEGEFFTDVNISSGTDYEYAFSLPKNFYASAVLHLFTFDVDIEDRWNAAPILLDGEDSGFRLTLVEGTNGFNPGFVQLDEFVLDDTQRLTLIDGDLTVTLEGSAVSTGDGAVLDYIEIEYVLADCNDNGVLDHCDVTGGTSQDCNANGLPDECELSAGVVSDCNNNDILDECDIASGTSIDCNNNDVPDECDLADGTSADCNDDDVPDECPICPVVQVVFVMDTSGSMDDEGAALCGSILDVVSELEDDGLEVEALLLGISNNPGGDYSCLTDNVIELLGTDVPGTPPPGNETLGDCPGGDELASEDWGRATSVVAGLYPWTPDSIRLIVPLSDEGPWCGDPVDDPGVDRDSITHAITIALANGVIVSPITGTGSSDAVIDLAEELAAATGGMSFSSSKPVDDIAAAIAELILDACSTVFDCNANGVPDDCDLAAGTSTDCNANAIPDECEEDICPGDVNDDCLVDPLDSGFILARFGCSYPEDGEDCLAADANGDGNVDPLDSGFVLARFGDCP